MTPLLRVEFYPGIPGQSEPIVRVITSGGEPMGSAGVRTESASTYREVMGEYVRWGEQQGGKGGRPWSAAHRSQVALRLNWWWERLKVEALERITVQAVEAQVPKVPGKRDPKGKMQPASGKNRKDYLDCLLTFRRWAASRGYLELDPYRDPLKAINRPDATPEVPWRALKVEEYRKVLGVATPFRRELYEALALTGLRRQELRRLKVGWLDRTAPRIVFPAAAEKTRRRRVLHLAPTLYRRMLERAAGKGPDEDLYSFDPSSLSQEFQRDLRNAGVPRETPDGKATLHGLRDTAATILQQDLRYDVASVQQFLRHATPNMTLSRYTTVSQERQAEMVLRLENLLQNGERPCGVNPTGLSSEPHRDESSGMGQRITGQGDAAEFWYPHRDLNRNPVPIININVYPDKPLSIPQDEMHQLGLSIGELISIAGERGGLAGILEALQRVVNELKHPELARGGVEGHAKQDLDEAGLSRLKCDTSGGGRTPQLRSDGQKSDSSPVLAKPSQPVSSPAREPNSIGGVK